jgi:acyl carrier protein
MDTLKQELKENIIECLNLEEFTTADIADDDPLFGDGLGLDSIDALELIVMMDKEYGIKLVDPGKSKEIFQSIEVLAQYIAEHRKK